MERRGVPPAGEPKAGASCPVLVLTSAVDQPAPSSSARLKHAYDLRSELDPSWAARPLELIHDHGKPALVSFKSAVAHSGPVCNGLLQSHRSSLSASCIFRCPGLWE